MEGGRVQRGQDERITKENKETSWGDEYIDILISIMAYCVYTYVKIYQIIHFKYVTFIVRQLYFNERVF